MQCVEAPTEVSPRVPLVHAWPDDSLVSLCGKARQNGPIRVTGMKCPDCTREARRKSFAGR